MDIHTDYNGEKVSQPGVTSDHQIGFLNQFQFYPYQGIV
jgi:hypothetical protein